MKQASSRRQTVLNLPSHPCLPVLIGMCSDSKPYLLVTKFYGVVTKGVFMSVSGLLNSANVDIVIWTSIVLDIAEGLCHMHLNGFIHGEIKAENIILHRKLKKSFQPVFLNLHKGRRMDKCYCSMAYQNDMNMFASLVDVIINECKNKASADFLHLNSVSQCIKDMACHGNMAEVVRYLKNMFL